MGSPRDGTGSSSQAWVAVPQGEWLPTNAITAIITAKKLFEQTRHSGKQAD